jgi:type IX secretion system PorP/SprF family membrane protein
MNRILTITILLIALIPPRVQGQNQVHLSQYNMHLPFINPAAIGIYTNWNGAAYYRHQWAGFEGAPVYQGLNFSAPVKSEKHFMGGDVSFDKIGINTTADIGATYAYGFRVSPKSEMRLGITTLLRLSQSRYSDLTLFQQNDPEFQGNTPVLVTPNFRFGALWFSKKYFAGLSSPSLLKSYHQFTDIYKGKVKFDLNDTHWYLTGGYVFEVEAKHIITPSVLLKVSGGAPLQADINLSYSWQRKFGGGVSFRTSKELSFMVNWQFTDMLRLGYAYDLNLSPLKTYNSGTHEIMLVFQRLKNQGIAFL